jgi:hypothetical protein
MMDDQEEQATLPVEKATGAVVTEDARPEKKQQPVCWFGAACFRKSKKHLGKYAHPASSKSSTNLLASATEAVKQIIKGSPLARPFLHFDITTQFHLIRIIFGSGVAGKRKRDDGKDEQEDGEQKEDEEATNKRLKPFEGDEEPTQPEEEEEEAEAVDAGVVEPTLIDAADDLAGDEPTQIVEEVEETITQIVIETTESNAQVQVTSLQYGSLSASAASWLSVWCVVMCRRGQRGRS